MDSKNPVTKRRQSSTTSVLQSEVKVVLSPVAQVFDLALCNGIRGSLRCPSRAFYLSAQGGLVKVLDGDRVEMRETSCGCTGLRRQ